MAALAVTTSSLQLTVPTRRSRMTMLRNQDRPELFFFLGRSSVIDEQGIRSGVTRLIKEANEASTPCVWLLREEETSSIPKLQVKEWPSQAAELPSPTALQIVRESFEIIPDAFGGSDGFGRQLPQAPRAPLPQRCVVFAAELNACIAGRAAGMRVVGVGEEDLEAASDVAFYDLDDHDWWCSFDDLFTPGSYWVNPPVPRTLDGYHCDPFTGERIQYSSDGAASSAVAPLSDEELAVLSDLAPPPSS